jgi:hypothetical protein
MRRVLVNLGYLVPLALWTGAAVGLTFLTTPVIFAELDRDTASRLVGLLFPGYFRLGLICVTLALVASLASIWALPKRTRTLWAIPAALALMLAIMAYGGLVLQPQIAAVQAQIPSFLTDATSPARQEFRRLHGLSSILNVITMALAATVWVLTALDPRLLTGRQPSAVSRQPSTARTDQSSEMTSQQMSGHAPSARASVHAEHLTTDH